MSRLLFLCLFLSSCAAATASHLSPLFNSPWEGPNEQLCNLVGEPNPLPRPYQLIDTSAVYGALERLIELYRAAQSALFYISYDSLGAARSPRLVESNLPDSARAGLEAAVANGLRPQPPAKAWGVLLGIRTGGGTRFRIGRAEECRPVLLNRAEVTQLITREFTAIVRDPLITPPSRPVVLRLFVDTTGAVTRAEPHSLTLIRPVDSLAIHVARQMRFAPAQFNRESVPVWIGMPIQFQIQEPPRRDTAQAWPR